MIPRSDLFSRDDIPPVTSLKSLDPNRHAAHSSPLDQKMFFGVEDSLSKVETVKSFDVFEQLEESRESCFDSEKGSDSGFRIKDSEDNVQKPTGDFNTLKEEILTPKTYSTETKQSQAKVEDSISSYQDPLVTLQTHVTYKIIKDPDFKPGSEYRLIEVPDILDQKAYIELKEDERQRSKSQARGENSSNVLSALDDEHKRSRVNRSRDIIYDSRCERMGHHRSEKGHYIFQNSENFRRFQNPEIPKIDVQKEAKTSSKNEKISNELETQLITFLRSHPPEILLKDSRVVKLLNLVAQASISSNKHSPQSHNQDYEKQLKIGQLVEAGVNTSGFQTSVPIARHESQVVPFWEGLTVEAEMSQPSHYDLDYMLSSSLRPSVPLNGPLHSLISSGLADLNQAYSKEGENSNLIPLLSMEGMTVPFEKSEIGSFETPRQSNSGTTLEVPPNNQPVVVSSKQNFPSERSRSRRINLNNYEQERLRIIEENSAEVSSHSSGSGIETKKLPSPKNIDPPKLLLQSIQGSSYRTSNDRRETKELQRFSSQRYQHSDSFSRIRAGSLVTSPELYEVYDLGGPIKELVGLPRLLSEVNVQSSFRKAANPEKKPIESGGLHMNSGSKKDANSDQQRSVSRRKIRLNDPESFQI